MAMVPYRHREFHRHLMELVGEGKVPSERIDDAVTRILRVKAAMGLVDPSNSPLTDRSRHAGFSGRAHEEVARQAVRESVVVLKNEGGVLPLGRDSGRILVAGAAAHDLGRQCGGWTISWQGRPGADQLQGTTILDAIRTATHPGGTIEYASDGAANDDADVAVVVVGESPYAEGLGDDFDLELSEADKATIERVAATGTPMVLVVVSGRPLAMTDAIDKADAVVAAWLPGTAGAGVADILFGDQPATGRLSFSWPRTADQHPINVGDPDYRPLYPAGHGLNPVRTLDLSQVSTP